MKIYIPIFTIIHLFSLLILAQDYPKSLNNSIHRISPNARVLKYSEIDTLECGKESKSIIKADFNGDKINDYAILLIDSIFHEMTYRDQKYLESKLFFVVFLGQKDNKYKSILLDTFQVTLPVINTINIYTDKTVKDREADTLIKIKYPSVELFHCGKSSVLFYWNKIKFESTWTSD